MIGKLRNWFHVVRVGARSLPKLEAQAAETLRLVRGIEAHLAAGVPVSATISPGTTSPSTAVTQSAQSVHATIKSVWNDFEDEAYRQDQSHYRGVGRWADDAAWQKLGQRSAKRLALAWKLAGKRAEDFKGITILEWGPGGGTNAFALRDIATKYIGVDIAEKNLAETSRQMAEAGRADYFVPILLSDDIQKTQGHVPAPVDAFLSAAVFQHFPSKEYGKSVLQALRAVCKQDAAGFIQIRFDNGNKRYSGIASIEEYKRKHIRATSYALDEFWTLLLETGFRPVAIDGIKTDNNQATFYATAS